MLLKLDLFCFCCMWWIFESRRGNFFLHVLVWTSVHMWCMHVSVKPPILVLSCKLIQNPNSFEINAHASIRTQVQSKTVIKNIYINCSVPILFSEWLHNLKRVSNYLLHEAYNVCLSLNVNMCIWVVSGYSLLQLNASKLLVLKTDSSFKLNA